MSDLGGALIPKDGGAAIEIAGLSLVFETNDGPVNALSGIDLTVERGEFVSFIGPSGCGKTTLLRVIADLERPTGGSIRVNGVFDTGLVLIGNVTVAAVLLVGGLRVLDGAASVMRDALAQGGTSFDALYVNVNGASGYFDRSLAVYGQQGRPCPRCGTPVVRVAFANRSSHYCPVCQAL